jgi:hypothetical protein
VSLIPIVNLAERSYAALPLILREEVTMNCSFLHLPQGSPPLRHFLGVLLVIMLAVLQGRVGRIGAFWQICWALPGTILHELSHFLVAAVTGGRPTGFSIIPRRGGGNRWILGSVTISRPGPISALPSALAPLALNAAGYYLYVNWSTWFPADLPHTLLMYGAVYLFCYSSIPSDEDLKVAVSSPFGLVIYIVLCGGAWTLWR